ncbi:hypothetical protein DPMN_125509 [Dreissena polymorpha]|uniref:Uncharacterized protein n=1 Tax=Dreissena polymorpha TaxID=45954 RepID=A0A9D4GXY1_DREPO|nr:hypothetical protein DPMN_125509 [Dreissena polymorpha]
MFMLSVFIQILKISHQLSISAQAATTTSTFNLSTTINLTEGNQTASTSPSNPSHGSTT